MNFDFNKIENFDEHIDTSIPNYAELRSMVASLTHHLVPDGGVIEDLGCSTGALLLELHDKIPNVSFVGVDLAKNLFPKEPTRAMFIEADLKKYKPRADVVIMMFTLMFLPKEERTKLLKRIRDANQNAILVVAEKTYMERGIDQEMFTFSHLDYKSKSFSEVELIEKQKSIRTIMKPLTEEENISMFRECGYGDVLKFWQSFQFMAWILK